MMQNKLEKILSNWQIFRSMPEVDIYLMESKTQGTDPFFSRVTKDFYTDANKRHKKMPIFKKMVHGVALCGIRNGFDNYLTQIESSGRRNYKKALRNGYQFRQINFNEHLDEIWNIRRSTTVRQGKMPDSFINEKPKPVSDPKPETKIHSYSYFGIFNDQNMLVAYAGCIQAGELLMILHIYGHSKHQNFGIIPMLFISLVEHTLNSYPYVRFIGYGTYFGASDSMKRFKKKFNFLPYKVKWHL